VRCFALAALFLFIVTLPTKAQVPKRPLQVVSCAEADTLLGSMGDDRRGRVRGFYSPDRDETFLTVGSVTQAARASHYFGATIRYFGANALTARDSVAWGAAMKGVALFLRGPAGLAFQESGSSSSAAVLFADDSVVDITGSPTLGQYRGPPEMAVVPVSYLLPYRSLLQVARADRVEVRLGDKRYEMSKNDRRNLRAMLRIALCSGAPAQ
jgi:hypothetical protein